MFILLLGLLTTINLADSDETPPVWKRADAVMASKCPAAAAHRKNGDSFSLVSPPGAAVVQGEFIGVYKAVIRCAPHTVGIDRAYLYAEAIAALSIVAEHSDDSSQSSQSRDKEKALLKLAMPLAKPDHDLIDVLHTFDDQLL